MDILRLVIDTINKYEKEIRFSMCSKGETPYCYIEDNEIYIPFNTYIKPTFQDLLDLYHEIGHIKTNTLNMKECEKEFYATQWAFDQLRLTKISIPESQIKRFQDYIWSFIEEGCPTKEELTLK